MTCRPWFVLLVMIALCPAIGAGQQAADSVRAERATPNQILEDFISEERTGDRELPRPELPATEMLTNLAAFDSASAAAYLSALRGLYEYQARGFLHRSRVFNWQYYSSIVIFGVVNLLVLAGLVFSWMQFRRGWKDGMESEMELSSSGVKIRSSVLGVIILVVSLAFFYLYLVYVYPIAEII